MRISDWSSDVCSSDLDTMWANMALAYEKLPDHVKAQIDGLRARHSIEATFGAVMPIEKRLAFKAQFPDPEHPVVRTHPETGEKVLGRASCRARVCPYV